MEYKISQGYDEFFDAKSKKETIKLMNFFLKNVKINSIPKINSLEVYVDPSDMISIYPAEKDAECKWSFEIKNKNIKKINKSGIDYFIIPQNFLEKKDISWLFGAMIFFYPKNYYKIN